MNLLGQPDANGVTSENRMPNSGNTSNTVRQKKEQQTMCLRYILLFHG